jgi:hypothetical protein
LRAESLSEFPVIGRMIAASERRAHAAGDSADADAASGASLLPFEAPLTEDAEVEPDPPALTPHPSKRA